MSANQYINPAQFHAAPARKASAPPVTPPTSAPVSAGATNAAQMWAFSKASQTASAQAGS